MHEFVHYEPRNTAGMLLHSIKSVYWGGRVSNCTISFDLSP